MPETMPLWRVRVYAEVLIGEHVIAAQSPDQAEREADRRPTHAVVERVPVGPDRR